MIDLLVAGAGPVGLAVAINAALAGLEVVVIDPRTGRVDKACGEGLMPDARARLARIGVDPPGRDFAGIRYIAGDRVAEARFSGPPGRGVRRTALHDALSGRARDLGVRFVVGRVEDVRQSDEWIEAAGIQSRYLVGADGLHSPVRGALGLAPARSDRRRFGIRQHFSVEPWTDLVEVHWLDDAEVYVTPVEDRMVGVAALGAAPLHLDAVIRRLPELAGRLSTARPASLPRGAGPLRQNVRARHVGRAMLAGDAAGYVDALTGEGLRVGFAEAEAVVRAVLDDDPQGYETEWQRVTRSYRWITRGLLWTSSQHALRPFIVPAASRFPRGFRRMVDALAA